MAQPGPLRGRMAAVAGGARNIDRAIPIALAQAGTSVAVNAESSKSWRR